jgi:hypothetical protein
MHLPFDWFMALEQPSVTLFRSAGLLSDEQYLERLGFIPSPKSIDSDAPTLKTYGYAEPAGAAPATDAAPQNDLPFARHPSDNRHDCRLDLRVPPMLRIP